MTMLDDNAALRLLADLSGVRNGQNRMPLVMQLVENFHDEFLILFVKVARE